jgi:hypothetical protein
MKEKSEEKSFNKIEEEKNVKTKQCDSSIIGSFIETKNKSEQPKTNKFSEN